MAARIRPKLFPIQSDCARSHTFLQSVAHALWPITLSHLSITVSFGKVDFIFNLTLNLILLKCLIDNFEVQRVEHENRKSKYLPEA